MAIRNKNKGAVLIEAAFLLPMFFLVIFGIFEVYRMKVAERLLDTISISIANEFAVSGDISTARALQIIKRCNKENTMNIIPERDLEKMVKCNIDVYDDHNKALTSPPNSAWIDVDGDGVIEIVTVTYHSSSGQKVNRGDMVAVTCLLKYNHLMKLTQKAFSGKSSSKKPIMQRRHFAKGI